MERDMNVYKKVGRKYVPIGLRIEDHYLTDGIWIVRHREYSKCTSNADYLAQCYGLIKAGDNAKIDLTKLASMEEYADVVADTISKVNEDNSIYAIARRIVKDLFDYNEKLKK